MTGSNYSPKLTIAEIAQIARKWLKENYVMRDYFDTNFYFTGLEVGKWNRPHKAKGLAV